MRADPELIDYRIPERRGPFAPEVSDLQWLARWMDSAFEIPGLRLRFGVDAILGLLPGLGDIATSLIALYILQEAGRRGVSRLTMARMASNVLIDWLLGSIPILGDVFDVYWKANERNVALLTQHVDASPQSRRRLQMGDWLFFALMAAALITILVGSLTISYFLIVWMGSWLFPAAA